MKKPKTSKELAGFQAALWTDAPSAVAYGGGVNSPAMVIDLVNRKQRIDLVLFSDTGGELKKTYDNIQAHSDWLCANGYPEIKTIKKGGINETLEEYCHRTGWLPSLAYGTKGCSWKFKIEPQNRECNRFPTFKEYWKSGGKVIKYLGYSAEEKSRVQKAKKEDEKYIYKFPLFDQGISRSDCIEIIKAAGLPVNGKSSCFFCPASKKHEILNLIDNHPDLYERALALEKMAAESGNHDCNLIKGLGRSFSWSAPIQDDLFKYPEVVEGCFSCIDDTNDRDEIDG